MLLAVYDGSDWCAMRAQYCLFACLEIYPSSLVSIYIERATLGSLPLDLPIHTCAEGFIVVGAEAHIEYRGSVLVLLDQPSAHILVLCIIQVNVLVPRRDQQPCGGIGREFEGGDRI